LDLEQFEFQSAEKVLQQGHVEGGIWGGGKVAEKISDGFGKKRGSEI